MSKHRIYVDTNVLANYFTRQPADVQCLDYLFLRVRKEILFTSSLAVVQTVSVLQTGKKGRKAFTREAAVESGELLYTKFSVIDLSAHDVKKGFQYLNNDVEDSVHYVLSKKLKCSIIITNNVGDFADFGNVVALSPKNISGIKSVIK
jgi:predicted nucleic acid-binding protein